MRDLISEFIRVERARLDITQKELADNAGVSNRSIVSIEKADKVSLPTLEKVLDVFGCDLELSAKIKKTRPVKDIKKGDE